MTIRVGTEYIHTVLGYQDAQGAIVITEDTGLATMTGRYVDNLPTASTNPDAYTWTELADPEEADDTEDDTNEEVEDTSSVLYRMAGTQMTEAIQDNLAVGTNQGASGWSTATGTIDAASCQPDGSAEAVNGVAWTATAGGTLLRTEHIPGEAVPETVTVSFWWLASAACGLTVSIGNNESETQYNHDSTDLDEDGNALDLTDAWLFFRALIPIAQTADDYAVKVATDSAATISICDFKVEPGDKVTAWTESAKAAMSAAQTADSKAQQADSKAQAADDKAQAAGNKATAADEKAQAAGTTAQAVQTALNGLTKVQDGKVLIDGDKVYLSAAFVKSIFAQDITATGTITGAKLIGAILSGEKIDISASDEYYSTSISGTLSEDGNPDIYMGVTYDGDSQSDHMESTLCLSLNFAYMNGPGGSKVYMDSDGLMLIGNAIQFSTALGDFAPYYTAGDTVTITRMYCAGGVTGSGTNLYFYIPLARPLFGVSNVTISNPTKAIITARKVEGGYIAQDAIVSSLGTPSCVPYEGGVTIGIKASSAYNTKNNTPVTVTPENLVLKFT